MLVKKKNPFEKVAHILFPAAFSKEGPPPFLKGALLHPGLFATVQPVLNQVIQLFLSERFCNQINVSPLLFRMKDRG